MEMSAIVLRVTKCFLKHVGTDATSWRYQFTAGTLLAATLWIAAPLASYRAFGGGHRGQAIAIQAAHLLLVGFVFWRFFRR